MDDIRLSDALDIPYYGCIEEARRYQGGSGINFLSNLQIPTPPSIHNPIDMNELLKEFISLL